MDAPLYLDHNATTPECGEAIEAELAAKRLCGNASSAHLDGEAARRMVDNARQQVASLLGVDDASRVVFTSGATEANNLAILGSAEAARRDGMERPHIVVSSIEHSSVLAPARKLARLGLARISEVPVDASGIVRVEDVARLLAPDTVLVSVQGVNNEIGTIQPVEAIGALCRSHGIRYHVDLCQAAGRVPFDPSRWDIATLSAHKLYGPTGVGAIVARPEVLAWLEPQSLGGGQEGGRRAGTLNLHGIAGFGAAAHAMRRAWCEQGEGERLRLLRDRLVASLLATGLPIHLNGALDPPCWEAGYACRARVAHNLNFVLRGIDGPSFHAAIRPRVSLSAGSACKALGGHRSHVLQAIGAPEDGAVVRLALGASTTEQCIERAVRAIVDAAREAGSIGVAQRDDDPPAYDPRGAAFGAGSATVRCESSSARPSGAVSAGDHPGQKPRPERGKPPWSIPTNERPVNPFVVAANIKGRMPDSVAEVEAIYGMRMSEVVRVGGPLYDPDLAKILAINPRPAGALVTAARAASAPRPGPAPRPFPGPAARSDLAVRVIAPPLVRMSGPRPAPPIGGTAAAPPPERPIGLRDPDALLRIMGLTSTQWLLKTCAEQVEALQLAVRGNSAAPVDDDTIAQWRAIMDRYDDRTMLGTATLYDWTRRGPFLAASETPLATDPIQGMVGNCFYIASLSGAAWVRPDMIAAGSFRGGERRPAPPGQQTINFYMPGVARADNPITITDDYPGSLRMFVADDGRRAACPAVYCTPKVFKRTWPSAYEKAMAAWRTGSNRRPFMGGREAYYVDEATHPALNIAGGLGTTVIWLWRGYDVTWRYLVDHASVNAGRRDHKASSVLVAGTATPNPDGTVVPNHVYTVLGIRQIPGSLAQQQVVLRNPWGRMPPGDPHANVGDWMGLRLGEDGVGVMNLEPFHNAFDFISGNWYGTQRDYDYGTDARWDTAAI